MNYKTSWLFLIVADKEEQENGVHWLVDVSKTNFGEVRWYSIQLTEIYRLIQNFVRAKFVFTD